MGKQQGRNCSSRYGSERLLYPVQVMSGQGGADHQVADLDEEDVWSVLDSSRSTTNGRQPEQQDRRGGGRWTAGGLSLAFEATGPASRHHHHHPHVAASSAPVKVPDWPAARFPPPGAGEQQQCYGVSCREEEGEWVAPHEYLQARSGAAAPSVFEGVGRTLKGRDLSRVRDAVWSSTGFFG